VKKLPITAIVLTKNEERNVRACFESIKDYVERIIVVDSDSTDSTLAIASEYGCEVYNHQSATQSSIYQWVLDEVPVSTEWTLRVDADERWTREGFSELEGYIQEPDLTGVYVNRKTYFMQEWLRFGGYYPIRLLLVWRTGQVKMENRMMDEHFIARGRTIQSTIDVIEANYDRQENLGLWTSKHNFYSDRYAAEAILKKYNLLQTTAMETELTNSTSRKSWLRLNVYEKSPLLIRCFGYYFYRYIVQLGFLDGKSGFIYHYLQAFWFRFLTDAKIIQLEQNISSREEALVYLREHLGIVVRDNKVYFE
jgi:glycosyltransferase involved in cell wall biosynthesis